MAVQRGLVYVHANVPRLAAVRSSSLGPSHPAVVSNALQSLLDLRRTPRVAALSAFIVEEIDALRPILTG